MFDNLTKEIFYYSLIPVAIIALIIIILIIVGKKKSDNYYKYNYSIKVLLSILLSFIVSIMIGYTVWVYQRVINLGIVQGNILYMIVLAVITVALFLSLIILSAKLYQGIDSDKDEEKKELSE